MKSSKDIIDKLSERFSGSVNIDENETDKDHSYSEVKDRHTSKSFATKKETEEKKLIRLDAERKIAALWKEYEIAIEFADKSRILADINFYRLKTH